MNRLQKKILTIALAALNISLTTVVAASATFAWFYMNRTVTGSGMTINCKQAESTVTWEVLYYSDDQKSGVSSTLASDFYLQPYDEYLTAKNKYSNVLLKATIDVSDSNYTSAKQLYIDINCDSASAFDYASANNTGVPNYTSNIAQFKTNVASYLPNGSTEYVEVNSAIIEDNADTKYSSASDFFGKTNTNAKFVALHNQTPYKKKNTITLVPSFSFAEQKVDKINLYIECSYNPELVSYYLSTHPTANGEISLMGDISEINFRIGDAYTGAYMKAKNQTTLDTSGDYLVVFDSERIALDGGADLNAAGPNYIDIVNRKNRIANDENTYASRLSYDTATSKLATPSGASVGRTTSSAISTKTNGIYANTLTYAGGYAEASTNVSSTDYMLRYNNTKGTTKFAYYSDAQATGQKAQLYKYDSTLAGFPALVSIATDNNQPTTLYVGDAFTFAPGAVIATYSDGSTLDVTPDCVFTGYRMDSISNQTVTVTYTEDEYIKTTTYSLSVINAPRVSLNYSKISGLPGDSITALVATTAYFVGSPLTYSWSSSDSSKASVSGTGNNPTITCVASGTANITVTVTTTSGESAEAVCVVTVKTLTIVNKTATYAIASSTSVSVTTTGDAPSGSSATFVNTYTGNKQQITSGKSMTLTLSGYTGAKITGITLNMCSNKSSGAGGLTAVVGPTNLATIAAATAYNDAAWAGAYSTNFADKALTLDTTTYEIQSGEDVVITISCSTNSLYVSTFTINYSIQSSDTTKELSFISVDAATNEFYRLDTFVMPSLITAHYDDLTTATIAAAQCTISGYDMASVGTQTVTVSYTEGEITATTTYTITVNEVTLVSIAVSGQKTSFFTGNTFSQGSLVVTATYNSGLTANVTASSSVTGPTSAQMGVAGTYDVTVSYTEGAVTKTATYQVTVSDPVISSISVKTQPSKTTYNVGDLFVSNGLVLTATYDDGHTEDITSGYTYKTTALAASDSTFTITYSGKTTTLPLTINTATVSASPTSLSGVEGASGSLTATSANFSGTVTYSWASNVTDVATVSATGSTVTVNYISGGSAVITVTATDGTQTATSTIGVTVTGLTLTLSTYSMSIAADEIGTFTVTTNGTIVSAVSSNTDNVDAEFSGTTVYVYAYSGSANITVTVTNGVITKTAVCAITVKTLSSITLNSAMTTTFSTGDTFNSTGLVVTAHYSDSSTADVTTDAVVTGPTSAQMAVAGTYTVTVTYGGQTATYNVVVSAAPVGGDVTLWSSSSVYAASTTSTTVGVISFYNSASNTYSNPTRLYANSSFVISIESGYSISQIVTTCTTTAYATAFGGTSVVVNAGAGSASRATSGSTVTITCDGVVTQLTIKMSAQSRVSTIVVSYVSI